MQSDLIVKVQELFDEVASQSTTEEISSLRHIQNKATQRIKELESVVPPLPDPDKSGASYKLFVPRSDALVHLSEVWGKWLKHFNPELSDRDYLYQDQLGERDPRLLSALRSRFSNDKAQGKSNAQIADILPPQSVRSILEVKELDPKVKNNLVRLAGVVTRHRL